MHGFPLAYSDDYVDFCERHILTLLQVPNNPEEDPDDPVILESSSASVPTTSASTPNRGSAFTVTVASDSTAATAAIPEKLSTRISKAEIKISLSVIENGFSYNSMDRLLPVLKEVDPKSQVWNGTDGQSGLSLGHSKISYVVSDCIGPHFHERHMRLARKAPGFSLYLDSATEKRQGLTKDLDLKITFWNEDINVVVEHLLEIIEVTTETSDVLLARIEGALSEHGLQGNNVSTILLQFALEFLWLDWPFT